MASQYLVALFPYAVLIIQAIVERFTALEDIIARTAPSQPSIPLGSSGFSLTPAILFQPFFWAFILTLLYGAKKEGASGAITYGMITIGIGATLVAAYIILPISSIV